MDRSYLPSYPPPTPNAHIRTQQNPSARLPFTYPKYTGTMLHQYHAKPSEKCTNLKAAFPSFDVIDCPVEVSSRHAARGVVNRLD